MTRAVGIVNACAVVGVLGGSMSDRVGAQSAGSVRSEGRMAVDSLAPRAARAYDIVRMRRAADDRWMVATVLATSGDTLVVALHGARAGAPATSVALDTIAAVQRRVLVPGSRAKAAAEGLYWGVIAGGIMGWIGGATYGALAGGTTWSEGGETGLYIGAGTLGIGGAIMMGGKHMRGSNGAEAVREEWVDVLRR